jgi:predicted Rossmann fold nucleotide-binding protein DprA/Smf involved in DNA uptake
MFLMDLLLGIWQPPRPTRSVRYRMAGGGSKAKSPAPFARARILEALTNEWKSNKQIARETGLQLNTVQQKTAKMFVAGKIDKITKKDNPDVKPVCMYRKKE